MFESKVPFVQHPFIKTTNVSEAEKFVTSALGSILLFPKYKDGLFLRANRYQLKHTDMWFCAYGEPVILAFPENDYYRFQFHQSGVGATCNGRQEFAILPHQGVVTFGKQAEIKFGADFEQIVLRIDRLAFVQKIAALMGSPTTVHLEFDPLINTDLIGFDTTRNIIKLLIDLLDQPQEPLPMILLEIEQALICSMLYSCANNYAHILLGDTPNPAPWQVRKVEEYIKANWDRAITIENIVEVSGCSARSIFRAFRKTRGYSPMKFVKKVRLQQAHEMLQNAEAGRTVTNIALTCGFNDFGRFSRDYKNTFGLLPSQTLKMKRIIN